MGGIDKVMADKMADKRLTFKRNALSKIKDKAEMGLGKKPRAEWQRFGGLPIANGPL